MSEVKKDFESLDRNPVISNSSTNGETCEEGASFEIRPPRPEEIRAIAEIEQDVFAVPWSEESIAHDILENPAARWLVMPDGKGGIAAYAGLWLVIDEGHILNVAVRREDQGKGYGKRIFNALVDVAIEEGMRLLTLEVRRSNIRAQNLYHVCGFLDVGYRKRYYDDNREDALIMYRDLV